MSALHLAIVASIQFALAFGAALLLWVIVTASVYAALRWITGRARPVDRGGEP